MWWNADDDNRNGTLDKDEEVKITKENNLVKITLDLGKKDLKKGKDLLQVLKGADKIKLWKKSTKGENPLTLKGKVPFLEWDLSKVKLPKELFIEGVGASKDLRDVVLKLRYVVDGKQVGEADVVKVTVVPLYLISKDGTDLYGVRWRPDGSYALAVGAKGKVYKYKDNALTFMATGSIERFDGVDWKSDGKVAILVGGTWPGKKGQFGTVYRFDATKNQFHQLAVPVTKITPSSKYTKMWDVAWQPGGDVAVIPAEQRGKLFTTDSKKVTYVGLTDTFDVSAVDWKPNGEYAMIVGDNGSGLRWDPKNGLMKLAKALPATGFVGIAWRPDGNEVLLGAQRFPAWCGCAARWAEGGRLRGLNMISGEGRGGLEKLEA